MAENNSPRRARHFSMLRGYRAADLLTLGNGAAGTGAIFALMSYLHNPERWRVYVALWLFPVALALDVADGRVARRHDPHSPFGGELDSLADVVSFGVAPAALAYALGMRGGLDVPILLFFVVYGISRLARYNVTAPALSDESGKVKYFEGTPIPSTLVLALALGLCFYFDRTGDRLPGGALLIGDLQWHPMALLYLASGSAMISKTLRIPKL